jgi:L-rhamnose isomerase
MSRAQAAGARTGSSGSKIGGRHEGVADRSIFEPVLCRTSKRSISVRSSANTVSGKFFGIGGEADDVAEQDRHVIVALRREPAVALQSADDRPQDVASNRRRLSPMVEISRFRRLIAIFR